LKIINRSKRRSIRYRNSNLKLRLIVFGLAALFLIESCDDLEPVNPTDPTYALKSPTLVSAKAVTDIQIDINWLNNEEYAEEFVIQRRSGSKLYSPISIVTKDELSFSDTNCALGVSYSYAIFSKVGSNQSAISNERTIATSFPAPSDIEVITLSDISTRITWEDNCNYENGYIIERGSGSQFIQITQTDENVTNYSDNGLIPDTAYTYRIAGYTANNNSSWLTSIPSTTIFPAPFDLIATPLNESEMQLSWSDTCSFEDGFIIERDSGSGFEQLNEISTNITNYTDIDLSFGVIYTYRVRAFTSSSVSSYSNTFSARVLNDGFIFISGGTYTMGDLWGDGYTNETPTHEVSVNDFNISPYEITSEQYIEFLNSLGVGSNGFWYHTLINMENSDRAIGHNGNFYFMGSPYASSERDPVTCVSWWGAMEYCNWLSLSALLTPCYTIENGDSVICDWAANGYRLPTEAEWEYAARSGGRDDQKWSGTSIENEIENYTWFRENSNYKTHPVGELEPNDLGLYDMSGNVMEFCWDWWGSYTAEDQNNPHGPTTGAGRVIRGGDYSTIPVLLRCSQRNGLNPIASGTGRGFRIVRNG
jgi:formylglycine-generating enzyme required for sulfatase activity